MQAGKKTCGKLCDLGETFDDSSDDDENNYFGIDKNHYDNENNHYDKDSDNNIDKNDSSPACAHPNLDLCPVESNPKLGNATRWKLKMMPNDDVEFTRNVALI